MRLLCMLPQPVPWCCCIPLAHTHPHWVAASSHTHTHTQHLQELNRDELAKLLQLSGSNFKVELVMRLLGLAHARDTMIGSAMVSLMCDALDVFCKGGLFATLGMGGLWATGGKGAL